MDFLQENTEFANKLVDFVCFGFCVKWHHKLHGLTNAEAVLVEGHQGCYLTHRWGGEIRGFKPFPRNES